MAHLYLHYIVIIADVYECDEGDPCRIYNKTCINSEGHYMCQCKSGFQETDEGNCIGEQRYL